MKINNRLSISKRNKMQNKVKVSFNPQDPVAGKQYIEEMPADMYVKGLENSKLKVVDSKYPVAGQSSKAEYIYPEGTPQADQVEIFTALNKEVNLFKEVTGTEPKWATGSNQLTLNAHAGKMANAYYSRWEGGIKFFYFPDSVNSNVMHQTSESAEISTHEGGHAILDAVHPSYLSGLRGETGAVHEAFGDMSAMVVALSDPNYIKDLIKETGGNLRQSTSLSYMGEDFGKGIYGATKPGHNYIRNAFNNFVYQDPSTLPYRPKDENQLGSEVHNFSRLMSGTFYELINDIYDNYRNQDLSDQQALTQTGKDAAKLLYKGIMYMPSGDAKFKDVALGMLSADKIDLGGKFKDTLSKVFIKRKILNKNDIDKLYSDLDKVSRNFDPKLRELKEKIDKSNIDLNKKADLYLSLYAKDKVNKGYKLDSFYKTNDGKEIIHYVKKEPLVVLGKQFAVFDNSELDLQAGLTLIVGKDGNLLAKVEKNITNKDKIDALKELLDMIKHGEVKFQDKDSFYKSYSPNDIFKSNGQPYIARVEYPEGRKKIVRIPVIS